MGQEDQKKKEQIRFRKLSEAGSFYRISMATDTGDAITKGKVDAILTHIDEELGLCHQ